jgi:hypothetical protein
MSNLDALNNIGQKFEDFNPQTDDKILRIVQNWGNEFIAQMQNRLRIKKTNASSSLAQSIQPQIKPTQTGYNLSILMNDYWLYVENGRKPTTKGGDGQLYKNIYEWIQNKQPMQRIVAQSTDKIKATKSLAYVITRKIHREGTKPQPFISPGLKQVTTATLAKRISTYIVDSLTK